MALTRKMLKAMGIEDDKIDQIIEAHAETTDGLKSEIAKYKEAAEQLPNVQNELDDLKAKGDDGYKEKYESEKKAFSEYKSEIAEKESRAAKETAVKAYLESKNIKEGNLIIAMRGLSKEIDAAELDGNKLKDTAALDALIAGDYAGLVTTVTETGATPPANPPTNNNTPASPKSLKEALQERYNK